MSTDIVRDATIADRVESCLESFRILTLALNGENCNFRNQIQLEDVEDEFGRFRIWSGNIGAHRIGRSSLDYRLRDASHIRQRVVSLLEDLKEILQEATAIIRGENVPWDCLSSDSNSDSENPIEDVEAEGVRGVTTDLAEDTTELKQLQSGMAETVTLLLRLSMAIRNPAPHDQFMKSTNIDTSYYEEYDIMHVREKFPQAEEYLVTRLGRAISRRRQYLKYREAHHNRLRYGLKITENPTQDSRTEIVPQSTVASSLPTALKEVDYLDLTEDSGSEMGFSEASTATSANNTMNLHVPPLPKAAQDGMPFECPLCFMIISVRSTLSWKHHVYKDLHPFICTAKYCTAPDRLFEDRNRWFEHEKEIHMRFWQCVEGCHETFTSESLFEEHQRRKHQKTFTPNQLTALIKMHERQFNFSKTVECPLCREKTPFYPHFRRHLGKHQRQLALFALPSDLYQTKEGDDGEEAATFEDEAASEGEENDRSDSDVSPQEDGQKDSFPVEQFHPVSRERLEVTVTFPVEQFDPVGREALDLLVTRRPKGGANDELEDSMEFRNSMKGKFVAAGDGEENTERILGGKNEEDEDERDVQSQTEEHRVANRIDHSINASFENIELDNEVQKKEDILLEATMEEEKKKAEDEEFERKVKEKFRKAGYSDDYIEEVLHKKREEETKLDIDPDRTTYVKVNRKYLHPDTLDTYGLPWEWDGRDEEYIIIKKYIDHALLDELFEHTRKLKERKLITDPYLKESPAPNDPLVKKGDRVFVAREKSQTGSESQTEGKSPADRRRRWMFT